MSPSGRRGIFWFIAGGALALLAGRWVAGRYADWAFFRAIGFNDVWQSATLHTAVLAAGAFFAATAFAFANFFAVRKSIVSLVLPRQLSNLEFGEAVPTQRLTILAAAVAVLFGTVFALLPHDWTTAAIAWDRVTFHELEPYLERDLGWYVAWLPWEHAVLERTTLAVVSITVAVILLYASTPSVKWSEEGLYVSTWVRRHLAVLAGVIVLLVGWDWRLDRYSRLTEGSGIWGSGWTASAFASFDHRVVLTYLAIASFATIPIAVVLVWAAWRGSVRLAFVLVSALILGGPVVGALMPLAMQDSLNTPEARQREAPYLRTGALYTRRAYGVDEIARGSTAGLGVVPVREFVRRVSAWDPAALERWAEFERRVRAESYFAWRGGRSGLEGVVFAAPPHDGSPMTRWGSDRIWASTADLVGHPAVNVATPGLGPSNVVVAPGSGAFTLVSDTTKRIAAPAFEGTLARMALSWALQNPRLLLADPPTPSPRLVTHRDVRDRLTQAVPFLEAGPTVTALTRADSLYWVVELFSVSDRYPLSEKIAFGGRDRHYVRHAATAFVHGQTGRLLLIPVETPDAVTRAWMVRFPELFTSLDAAPDWIRTERPPAFDWGDVQGRAMGRVGFLGDTLGPRHLTRTDEADTELTEGAEIFFQLDATGSLAWGIPVDIPGSDQTIGIFVIRGGADARAEYHVFSGARWTAILEDLQEAATNAGYGRTRPNTRRGRVQAIPTPGGPAWVQSYYEWPPDAPPRLIGVTIRIGGITRTGRNIAAALGVPDTASTRALSSDAFRARVAALYETMNAALRAGDWRAYGDAWAALGQLLNRPP